ncbi:primosomal replication protein PriC [Entomohabitans teleogrylli]|uniref:primosomal replication protein PriC n=1 Tax=Entomohabitans teleogrylli TaxID=1384589 RepID=UPI00073D5D16|nr:primosomal replication protein [Entomohabitans teleogrylli]
MKSSSPLDILAQRMAALNQRLAPLRDHFTLTPRFDRQLFRCAGHTPGEYLAELADNVRQLRRYAASGDSERAAWLAERVVNQITALEREVATRDLRRYDGAHRAAGVTHRQLLQHQDYEQRLNAMLSARQGQLPQAQTLADQQRLQQEIAALHGRLRRCRAALERIQRRLNRQIR